MKTTEYGENIESINFKMDEQLEDILRAATCLYSKMDALVDSERYNPEEYPGNRLDELCARISEIIYNVGDFIGYEIARQALDMSHIKKGGTL